MKRIEFMLAAGAVFVTSAMGAAAAPQQTKTASAGDTVAQSESLGEYARAVRKEKRPPAKKVYTNDNLPTNTAVSVVGPSAALAASEDKEEAKDQEKEPQEKEKKDSKPADKKPAEDEQTWHQKIDQQNKKVADLEHELDVLQREHKLRITAYYADAGTQLRDPQAWAEEDGKSRADIADKQKQIEEAKARLQDMQEEARKAGMPSSVSESE